MAGDLCANILLHSGSLVSSNSEEAEYKPSLFNSELSNLWIFFKSEEFENFFEKQSISFYTSKSLKYNVIIVVLVFFCLFVAKFC